MLFDHAAHNGSNYLNGHCFVSLMLCIPVWKHNRISCLAVPLGYRMWQKKESKLQLAASMVRQIMPEFSQKKNVIVLCDRWYMKKSLVSVVDEYPNLDLIGNARSDSVIYDLAPAPTGSFVDYKDKSVQEFRFVISEGIRKQIFFTGFVQNIETQIKSKSVISAIKQAFRKHGAIYKVVKWYIFI